MSLLQFHQIPYLKESCRDTMSVRINHRMTYKARPHLFSPDDFISRYSVNGLIFQAVNGVKLSYGGAVLIADANFQFSVHEIGHFVAEGYNNCNKQILNYQILVKFNHQFKINCLLGLKDVPVGIHPTGTSFNQSLKIVFLLAIL